VDHCPLPAVLQGCALHAEPEYSQTKLLTIKHDNKAKRANRQAGAHNPSSVKASQYFNVYLRNQLKGEKYNLCSSKQRCHHLTSSERQTPGTRPLSPAPSCADPGSPHRREPFSTTLKEGKIFNETQAIQSEARQHTPSSTERSEISTIHADKEKKSRHA
jgi:hypothetical protein